MNNMAALAAGPNIAETDLKQPSGIKRPSPSLSISRDPRKLARQGNLDDITNQSTHNPPVWQTVPVQHKLSYENSNHKNMFVGNSNAFGVPLSNRFSDLAMDEDNENVVNAEKKVARPPPIILYGINDVTKLNELFQIEVEKSEYFVRTINNKQIKISTNSVETYKKIIELMRKNNLIGHTFSKKDERAYRVVLKNLHFSTPVTLIKEEIERNGHRIRGEIVNVKHRFTKEPLSMFFINLEPSENNKEIFELKYISNCVVTFEPPRKQNDIVQCKRCQQYGHTKNNCMRPYRCVKCAQAHNTSDCPKTDRNTPATCALCFGNHPANYKGCQVYKEISMRKMKNQNNDKSNQERQNARNFIKNDREFPYLAGQPSNSLPPSVNKNPLNSYAHVLTSQNQPQTEDKLNKLTQQIEMLVQQMSTLMGLLTAVVNKLIK
jgi:hypothetical protein